MKYLIYLLIETKNIPKKIKYMKSKTNLFEINNLIISNIIRAELTKRPATIPINKSFLFSFPKPFSST